ncbi:MAG TPA: hypothetical protein VGP16_26070 [Asanoa sp.]|jgi:hypothetical protein|nr:hypothetical protein [Asanoa sp.]
MRRRWTMPLFATAAALTAALSFAGPAAAYSPGTATPYRPTYNGYTGNWDYHCSFAGWRSDANVSWQCNLHKRWMNEYTGFFEDAVIAYNSGSWVPGSSSYTTATFTRPMQTSDVTFCTEAYAISVDGGVSQESCN